MAWAQDFHLDRRGIIRFETGGGDYDDFGRWVEGDRTTRRVWYRRIEDTVHRLLREEGDRPEGKQVVRVRFWPELQNAIRRADRAIIDLSDGSFDVTNTYRITEAEEPPGTRRRWLDLVLVQPIDGEAEA